jgi:hypothetical protein
MYKRAIFLLKLSVIFYLYTLRLHISYPMHTDMCGCQSSDTDR